MVLHLNKCKGGFMWDHVRRPLEIILLLPYNFVVAGGSLQQNICLPETLAFYGKIFSYLLKEYSLQAIGHPLRRSFDIVRIFSL